MIRALFLGLLLMSAPLSAQEVPGLYFVTGVAAGDVLNIRQSPDAAAPIIGSLAPDATGVEVTSLGDGWALVNTGEGSGYASAEFLTRQDGPPWFALQTPLRCLGTEPFWSFTLDPAAGEVSFSMPDAPAPQAIPISETWPGEIWAPAAAVALPDGLAVFSPGYCSDGMSELSYGISLDIFLQGTDRRRFSGCCTLEVP